MAGQLRVRHAGQYPLDQAVAQALEAGVVLCGFFIGDLQRAGHSHDEGNVVRAGAAAVLLPAAALAGRQGDAVADVQGADPLGAVELMGRDRQQIDAQGAHIQRKLAGGLHSVGVHQRAVGMGSGGDVRQGLHRADFVVGVHDADQDGIRPAGSRNRGRIDAGAPVDGDTRHLAVEQVGELARRLADGTVLYRGGDQVTAPAVPPGGEHCSAQGQIVALGAATGEHDLPRRAAHDPRHALPGIFHRLLRSAAKAVD